MNEEPEWFAPKRYGYGAGPPISWQGWLVTAAYVAVIFGALFLLRDRWVQLLGILVPATVAFIVITARTTRGGWRWRWGEED
jgi:hypothetical protein